jgi:hypothetical protein
MTAVKDDKTNDEDDQVELSDAEQRAIEIEGARRRIAWRGSPEGRRSRNAFFVIWSVVIALIIWISIYANARLHTSFFSFSPSPLKRSWPYLLICLFIVAMASRASRSITNTLMMDFDDKTLVADELRSLEDAEEQLAQSGELELAALWKVTQQRLDYYHRIVTQQARQSFRNAQVATFVGLIILFAAAAAAFISKSTIGSIVAGSLGAIGAAISGYIGRTFIRSQETAATQLRSYFDQPLEFSRYLAAERLIPNLTEDDRNRAVGELMALIIRTNTAIPQPNSIRQ